VSVARTSISLPEELYHRAVERQRQLGYKAFSEYVHVLIRSDLITGGDHLREAITPGNNKPVRYRLRQPKQVSVLTIDTKATSPGLTRVA
jgi:hypothetical protein